MTPKQFEKMLGSTYDGIVEAIGPLSDRDGPLHWDTFDATLDRCPWIHRADNDICEIIDLVNSRPCYIFPDPSTDGISPRSYFVVTRKKVESLRPDFKLKIAKPATSE